MNETLEKYKERYPELKAMFSSVVFLPKSAYDKYINDKKIVYKNMEISALLLVDILDSFYFEKVVDKLFKGEINDLKIGSEIEGELYFETLTRKEIIEALTILFDDVKMNYSLNIKRKYEYYKELISYDKLLEDKKDDIYTVEVENQILEIRVKDLLVFLQMDTDALEKICDDDNYPEISKVKKEYFFYAMYKYVKEQDIINKYLIPNTVERNYEKIKNLEMIDFEWVNKFYKKDDGIEKVKLNEELEKEIFKNMPSNLNKLEKSIYIYLKMCKLLSYDEEFFFANKEAEVLKKHQNIEHLQYITLEHNGVVCYEFNAIYAKLIKDLGLNFQSNNSIKESYGTNNHTMLDFRCGKYLVSADSLTSIFNGDIINVKLNGVINGLNCNNRNRKTVLEFYKILAKIYKIIKEEEQIGKFNITDFDDSNIINKLNILIDKTNFKGYIGMDFISYVLKLFKLLFNEDERMNHIKISIIKDYKDYLHGGIIFCVNTHGFDIGEENTYYLFDSRRNVKVFNRLELQELFDNEQISYYDNLYHDLPGIKRVIKK